MAGAGLAISVEIDDRQVREALTSLEKAGGNMHLAFQDIGEYLLISHRERFDNEQAPDGTPWEPLADSTLRRKMLKGVRRGKGKKRKSLTTSRGTKAGAIKALAGSKILVERGDLRDLLRYQAGGDSLEFGTDRIYGATQHFGDDDRNIPARPYLGLSDDDEAEVLRIIQAHLDDAMAA
ncbi:MAG: phage virion morphogenesis protein [Desulfobulbaceae bacterium]|nr:MAG: phage virion morphogenesis protein [Desulfobulbaceae bacterium]